MGKCDPSGGVYRFQIVLARNGVVQDATDVPFLKADIARPGSQAAARNPGITQLMAVAVTTAVKKDLINANSMRAFFPLALLGRCDRPNADEGVRPAPRPAGRCRCFEAGDQAAAIIRDLLARREVKP